MADELTSAAEDSTRGSFFLILGTAISTVVMAIASILIGRFLGPDLYGEYTLALVVPQMLFLFTDLGINQGIIKFTANLNTNGESRRLAALIRHGLLLKTLIGIIISIITWYFSDAVALIFLKRPDLALYIKIASIAILFQAIYTTAGAAFIGLDKAEHSALITNVQAIGKAVFSLALVFLGLGVSGAVIGHATSYLIAALAGTAILIMMLRKRSGEAKKEQYFSDDLKTLMRYGTPLYIAVLLTGFAPLYQNLMLATFSTDADVGNYRAAINFATLLSVISIPITSALLPAFSKLDSSTTQKIKTFFKLADKYTTLVILPTTILMITFSSEIVKIIYGSTFTSAASYLSLYCLMYFLVGIGSLTLPSFYNGIGETKMTLKIDLIYFISLIFLSPILTSLYNVIGLIVAFLIANTFRNCYSLYTAKKNFKMEFDTHSIIMIYLTSALSSIPLLLLLRLTSLSGLTTLTLGGFLYLFTYITLILLTKSVDALELQKATVVTQKNQLLALLNRFLLKYQQKILRARDVVS